MKSGLSLPSVEYLLWKNNFTPLYGIYILNFLITRLKQGQSGIYMYVQNYEI